VNLETGRETPLGRGRRFARAAGTSRRKESSLVTRAITRVKEGDAEALHFIYVRYADSVQGYVESIVSDSYEAEDITQTMFAGLPKKIRRYEPREVPFAGWLLRVARNAALDHLRGRRTIPVEEVRIREEGDGQASLERAQALRLALQELPGEQCEVLILRHIAGLSPGEIAVRMHKTESAIHGLHHRGRAALQSALRELDAAPVTAG
jgi:RNA polymerase sigma-70 factor, ECF subfamily